VAGRGGADERKEGVGGAVEACMSAEETDDIAMAVAPESAGLATSCGGGVYIK